MKFSTLLDRDALDSTLSGGAPLLPTLRKALQQGSDQLEYRFHEGEDIEDLVNGRAWLVDQILLRAWQAYLGKTEVQASLVAVGGYGRGELHPASDVDIMLLVDEAALETAKEALEAFLLLLWDIGLDIGHSVRTLDDCVHESEQDITVATNLMEARLLCGDEALFQAMREQTGPDKVWPSRHFFEAKWQEQIDRHHKFNDTAYNLEPNIKEGPGGLRDIQMVGWVAKRHFGAETLADLVDHDFLTPEEHRDLCEGQNFLWRIRYGLHILAKRREDRLLIEHQRGLATLFGYQDSETKLAVEQFMKDYYRTVMELERLNEMLLQLYQEEILFGGEAGEIIAINRRFQARNGFLEVAYETVFKHYPFAMLEIFLILAQHPELKGVRAGTIRLIRQYRDDIDDELRNDIRCRSLFMEFLRQPRGVTHELRRMNRYGLLAAYLPVFANIVGQMQHDLFHVYTVDEHTLFVIRNLRRLTVEKFKDEFPLASEVIKHLPKPELLYVAGLFHDIAKGRGGDHSELGAVDVEAFCRQHQLSDYDTRLTSWLVRNHLIMSSTAQRKDISDPEVINEFAAFVGDANHLDYLYLLTMADIRATGPNVWNSWKDSLLAELYRSTKHALRRGLTNPILQSEIISQRQREARHHLLGKNFNEDAIDRFWNRISDDYFLRYNTDEIAWHAEAVLSHKTTQPLIVLRQHGNRGGTELFIYTPIRGFQFSTTTAVLDQLCLNIVDARILSSNDGYTLDTYIVLEEDGQPIQSEYRMHEIEEMLQKVMGAPEEENAEVFRHMARQLKHFPIETQVYFEQDPHNPRTIMEVVTSDRPGLLSKIAQVLSHCDVRLHNAKITTFGEKAEDIFYITDEDNQPLEDEVEMNCLRQQLKERLDSESL